MQEKNRWNIAMVEGWDRIARVVATSLSQGDVLALQGPLGAGKTTFVQALARALHATHEPKSPTFSMLRTYAIHSGSLSRLLHVDAYRIEREVDLIPLDLEAELAVPGSILVIEWPEHVPQFLGARSHHLLSIRVTNLGRNVTFVSASPSVNH